jgi:hypothetical protein
MLTGRMKFLLKFFMIGLISLSFIGGDCSTDNHEDPPAPDTVAPPASMTFKVEAQPGGDSRVTFNWTASSDENDNDFRGYRIITVELNSNNNETIVQEQLLGKNIKTHTINPLEMGKRFITYILSERNNGTKSDSLETEVYAGVFYNTNGVIDSYVNNTSSMSGFGWNITNGIGTQYPYTQSNAGKIDIHIRELSDDPYFFSPGGLDQGFKLTRIKNIGSGQSAFDETDLPEADETFLPLNLGDVYLVKTQENYYAKVWVKTVTPPGIGQNYYTVTFDYKLQPIKGLRIL